MNRPNLLSGAQQIATRGANQTGIGRNLWLFPFWVALIGYIALNYGFTNLTIYIGPIPIIVGYLLMVMALIILLTTHGVPSAFIFSEPFFYLLFILCAITVVHLISDVPEYGIYAIRDASFVFEAFSAVLGVAWSRLGSQSLTRFLTVVLTINFLYALSFPFEQEISAISPVSGLFQQVPLLGFYTHTGNFLLISSIFFLLLARHSTGLARNAFITLALVQFIWSFAFQSRTVYVSIALITITLVIFRRLREVTWIFCAIFATFVAISVLTSTGLRIQGRLGGIEPQFYLEHLQSLLLVEDTPGQGSAIWRLSLVEEVLSRWGTNDTTMLFGTGFGEPLIDFVIEGDVIVRQPHNTHLTILARLGIIGTIVWILIHSRILMLIIRLTKRKKRSSFERTLSIWLFLFYTSSLLLTTFQPWLEFPHGAIPFFTFIGVIIGYHKRSEAQNDAS